MRPSRRRTSPPARGHRLGERWAPSSSTRRSPSSRWPVSTRGRWTRTSSTRVAAPSRSGPARRLRWPHRRDAGQGPPGAPPALGRCRDLHRRRPGPRGGPREPEHDSKSCIDGHRRGRRPLGGRRDRRWIDSPDRRLWYGRAACRAHRCADPQRGQGSDRGQQQRRQRPGSDWPHCSRTVRFARSSAHSRDRRTPTSSTSSIEQARWSSSWCHRAIWPNDYVQLGPASVRSSALLASGHRSPKGKEQRTIDGRDYVLEYPLKGDLALDQSPSVLTPSGTCSTARRPATLVRSWPQQRRSRSYRSARSLSRERSIQRP